MNKNILIAIVLVGITLTLAIVVSAITTNNREQAAYTSTIVPSGDMADIKLWSNVYVSKNGKLIYEGHNVFTDAGKEHVEGFLGAGNAGSVAENYIAVGNGTAPTSASTTLNTEITTAGLARATGTYSSTGTGAWKLEKIFSVTGTVNSINSTGLFNASAAGTMLAGDTFTNTNVISGDQLNITWTCSVS